MIADSARARESEASARPAVAGAQIAVPAPTAANLCGVSARHWRRMNAAGLVPRAVHLGRRCVWVVDELKDWLAAGAPPREQWETRHKQCGAFR